VAYIATMAGDTATVAPATATATTTDVATTAALIFCRTRQPFPDQLTKVLQQV
jgi:hypothetical protein